MCHVATASFDTRFNETVAVNSSQIEFNLTDNNLVEMDNILNGCLHSETLISQTGPMTMPSIDKTRPVTTIPTIFSTTVVTMNSTAERQRFPGTSSPSALRPERGCRAILDESSYSSS